MFWFLVVAAVIFFIAWRTLWWFTAKILASVNDALNVPEGDYPWAGEYEVISEVALVGGYPYRHIRKVREEGSTDYERHLLVPLTRACKYSLLRQTCIGFAVDPGRERYYALIFTGVKFSGPRKIIPSRKTSISVTRGPDWITLKQGSTEGGLHEALLEHAAYVERSLIDF